MKTLIQVVDVMVGLTVAVFVGGTILNVLDLGVLDFFNPIISYFHQLFGSMFVNAFVAILCGVFIIMGGRWVMSWASNNGGQTPNNKGN